MVASAETAIATYLIEVTDSRAMPGVWLSAAAMAGLIATAWSHRSCRKALPEIAAEAV
jgi:hypothetical protein